MIFRITLEPITISPVIRAMHRQTKRFEAACPREATRLVREAFRNGIDDSGTWAVVGQPVAEG